MERRQIEYIFAVFGISGRGKSTILNYLTQNSLEAKRNPLFPTSAGAGSCTTDVSVPISGNIYGTNQRVTVYDTPGSFSIDIPLNEWFELLKARLPNPFHALIWVLDVEQRVQPGETVLSQALEKIFDNFSMDKIIIVFTHCDRVVEEENIDVQALAQNWLELLNSKIKNKVDTRNIVLFGKEINGYDNREFIPSFLRALADIPQKAEIGMKAQIDKHAVMDDILMCVDEKMAKKFTEEQKKLEEDYIQRIRERDQEIERLQNQPVREKRLQNQPVREIHHYTETIVESGGFCNIF